MYIAHSFAKKEGGVFEYWDGSVIHEYDLTKRGDESVEINGHKVYCLTFESPMAGGGRFGRWDCVNGWTTTIDAAKRRWPGGIHGGPFGVNNAS